MKNKAFENKTCFVKDSLLWLAILALTALAFFFNYTAGVTGPVKAIIWVVWLVFALLIAFFTSLGNQVFQFANEAKNELLKVIWPSRKETIQTTSIVIIMVGVTGFVLWGIDSLMIWVIAKLTHLG